MKKVDNYRNHIMDELNSAMEYAENYVVYKNTHPQWAQMYHEMSTHELTHAEYLRLIAQEAMDKISYIPEEDAESWKKCQRKHAEKVGVIKFMLSK